MAQHAAQHVVHPYSPYFRSCHKAVSPHPSSVFNELWTSGCVPTSTNISCPSLETGLGLARWDVLHASEGEIPVVDGLMSSFFRGDEAPASSQAGRQGTGSWVAQILIPTAVHDFVGKNSETSKKQGSEFCIRSECFKGEPSLVAQQ